MTTGDAPYPDAWYRWNWFRRPMWWPSWRDGVLEGRGRSCGVLAELLGRDSGARVLDATCGLGRKSVVFGLLGFQVTGADLCGFAVERARELAREERLEADFYASAWRDLPANVPRTFHGVYVDAFMDCCASEQDLAAAFSGIAGVLEPGGVFVFPGPEPGQNPADILDGAWNSVPQHSLVWHFEADGVSCSDVTTRTRGASFIDQTDLYVITESGQPPRLEYSTIRQWFGWSWERLADLATSNGFGEMRCQAFPGYANGGGTLTRLVATRA